MSRCFLVFLSMAAVGFASGARHEDPTLAVRMPQVISKLLPKNLLLRAAEFRSRVAADRRIMSYREAWQDSQDSGRPMLVLLSMNGCPPCHAIKSTLDEMVEADDLQGVNVAVVEVDNPDESELARRLAGQHHMFPQLIYFESDKGDWLALHRVGYQSRTQILRMTRHSM